MKITLDIPDGTLCAVFSFVYTDTNDWSMNMCGKNISTNELTDGAEIKIDPQKEADDDER